MTDESSFPVLEIKSMDETGTFSGYGAVFDNIDLQLDVIEKGAFAASLKDMAEGKRRPAMLWQHNAHMPIGRWSDLKEDDHGLYVEGRLNLDVARGKEAYAHLKAGDLDGLSIGFRTKRFEIDVEGEIRRLKEVSLFEISIVTIPANPEARAQTVKSECKRLRGERNDEHVKAEAYDKLTSLFMSAVKGVLEEDYLAAFLEKEFHLPKPAAERVVAALAVPPRSASADGLSAVLSSFESTIHNLGHRR